MQHLFSNHYLPKVEIKYFNVLIDGKSFFDLPVKNKEKAYEKTIEMNSNNDYATVNLLNLPYFKNNERLISNDLSKQINLKDPQQINFIGKIGKVSAITFFIIKKLEETTFEFLQNAVRIIQRWKHKR